MFDALDKTLADLLTQPAKSYLEVRCEARVVGGEGILFVFARVVCVCTHVNARVDIGVNLPLPFS